MKPCVPFTAHLLAFHALLVNACGAGCQDAETAELPVAPGRTSCLIQHRTNASKTSVQTQDSPFSEAQWQCIWQYGASVDADLPGFTQRLQQRRFGGTGRATGNGSAILGVGFGTTATRSLTVFGRQLGLNVHHCDMGNRSEMAPVWTQLHDLTRMQHPEGLEGCLREADSVNFSEAFDRGEDLLLDTPMAEHFLDFYAVSPHSKVILTNRDSEDWVHARLKWKNQTMLAPIHAPCGSKLAELSVEKAARLYEAHNQLVRCMVPAKKLMEINVFDGSEVDVPALSDFLGKGRPEFPPLFPRVSDQSFDAEAKDEFAICVTGQIRRLELQTKVDRLIRPLMDKHFRVIVALVLDPRPATSYVHRASGEVYENFTVVDGNFTRLQQAAKMFPGGVTLIGDAFIPRDYPVDERYVQYLHAQYPDRGFDYAEHRAASHMRQWESMGRCGELLIPAGARTKYTMRLRDDSAVLERFEPHVDRLVEEGLYVPSCASYGGVNDKLALLVGQGTARDYFSLPLDMVMHRFDELHQLLQLNPPKHDNPEHALEVMLTLGNMKIAHLEPEDVPITPSKNLRRAGETYLCYYVNSVQYSNCLPERSQARLAQRGGGFSVWAESGSPRPQFLCEHGAQGF